MKGRARVQTFRIPSTELAFPPGSGGFTVVRRRGSVRNHGAPLKKNRIGRADGLFDGVKFTQTPTFVEGTAEPGTICIGRLGCRIASPGNLLQEVRSSGERYSPLDVHGVPAPSQHNECKPRNRRTEFRISGTSVRGKIHCLSSISPVGFTIQAQNDRK